MRPPHLPTWPIYVNGSICLCLAMGLQTTLWLRPADWQGVVTTFASTQCVALASMAAFPLLRRLGAVAPAAPDGGRWAWRWFAFYGAFIGLAACGYALRACWLAAWFGAPASWLEHAVRWGGPQPIAWLLLAWVEQEAAARAATAGAEATIRAEIERLFNSREALALANARRTDAVSASLADRVEPRIAAIAARLADARARAEAGEALPDGAIAALAADLDALADGELRALSHVLHPAIVQAGLGPALASLAAHHDDLLPIDLAVEAPAGPLATATVLTAYRVVEAALDNVRRHAAARGARIAVATPAPGRLRLEVADDGTGFDPAAAARGVGFATIDGRVALAGGSWGVEAAPGAGTRLWAELPT